jgi:hypothetical protein
LGPQRPQDLACAMRLASEKVAAVHASRDPSVLKVAVHGNK